MIEDRATDEFSSPSDSQADKRFEFGRIPLSEPAQTFRKRIEPHSFRREDNVTHSEANQLTCDNHHCYRRHEHRDIVFQRYAYYAGLSEAEEWNAHYARFSEAHPRTPPGA